MTSEQNKLSDAVEASAERVSDRYRINLSEAELRTWAQDAVKVIRALSRRASAGGELHGPFGWLNGCRGLSEDSWTIDSDPLENNDEYFAVPLYAKTDPFKEAGSAPAPSPTPVVAKEMLMNEIARLLPHYQSQSAHDQARRQMLEHFMAFAVALPALDPAAQDSGAEWTTDKVEGSVTVHSLTVGGVLCRWWGDTVPAGVATLNAALHSKALPDVSEALLWAMDEIDLLSNKLCNYAYPQGMMFLRRSDQAEAYVKAVEARAALNAAQGGK